MALAMNVFVKV